MWVTLCVTSNLGDAQRHLRPLQRRAETLTELSLRCQSKTLLKPQRVGDAVVDAGQGVRRDVTLLFEIPFRIR